MNVVQTLIEEIKSEAAKAGYTLHRYQANKGNFATTITYALHSSANRPTFSRDCDGASAVLTQREGSTSRCEAYRELSDLLTALK